RAIQACWSEKADPVVAPAKFPRKLSDGHNLENGNAHFREGRQMLESGAVGPLTGERTNMHFVNNLAFDGDSLPLGIGPRVARGVGHFGEFVWTFGLETRRGVRIRALAIDFECVASAFSDSSQKAAEVALFLFAER